MVRPRVAEIEGQRRLRVGAAMGPNAGGGAAERALPVSPDDKPRADGAGGELDGYAVGVARHRARGLGNVRKVHFRGARAQGGEQMAVLDIVAKGLKSDLCGGEADFGRTQGPPGAVNDAKRGERRGVRPAGLPGAQRCQRLHRARKQGCRAVIVRWRRGNEHHVHAAGLEGDGADEPRRPAADDRHLGRHVVAQVVHRRRLDLHKLAGNYSPAPAGRREVACARSRRRPRAARQCTLLGAGSWDTIVDPDGPEGRLTRRAAAAFSVHVFTACGAACALLAAIAAVSAAWTHMFAWLGLAFFIDGIDGTLARRLRVADILPRWSGETLDFVVDFSTYVFVPAYAIVAGRLLPPSVAQALGLIIVVTGALYFADRRMKTSDGYFRGFPALWNVAAFYLFVFRPAPWLAALAVAVLARSE